VDVEVNGGVDVSVFGNDGVLVGHTQSPLFKPAPFVTPELLVAQFC
jgi:hypothetical protein